MSRLLLRFAVLGLGLAPLSGAAVAANPAAAPARAAAGDPAVTMSPFEVQAMSAEFKRWIKVGSPHFIIYTDGSGADASRALRQLEMLRAAGQRFFGRQALELGPVTVILPTSSSDWRKLESKSNVEWKAAASTEAREIAELVVVQYDWQAEGIHIVHAVQASCEQERLSLRGPFWFARGLQSFCESAEFDKDSVALGRPNARAWALVHGSWIPWGRFFEVDGSAPEFTKEDSIDRYLAQSTLFTHFLFTNADRAWVTRLTAWLDYLNAGHAPTEPEFKAIFTQDWKTWQRTMERYIEEGRHQLYTVKVPPEASRFKETKFALPVREMRDLFVLAQTLQQTTPASDASLAAMLQQGLKTDALREFLAASCLKWERYDAALGQLRQLIAADAKNPRVYTVAANLLTEGATARLAIDVRLGAEVSEVRAWCQRALELEPSFPDANLTLAWAEALAPEVDQQSIATIEEAYRRVKDRIPADDVIAALAVALWRVGDFATARELSGKLKDAALGTARSRQLATALFERVTRDISAAPPAPAMAQPAK